MSTVTGSYGRHKPIIGIHLGEREDTTHALPLSEGDGGSLSSRSSAEDMVPVDGVLGSIRLKSPEHINKRHKFTQNNCTVHG